MKKRSLVPMLVLVFILVTSNGAYAGQSRLTKSESDILAQTVSDIASRDLVGVSESGWIYFHDGNQLMKERFDGTKRQKADRNSIVLLQTPAAEGQFAHGNLTVIELTKQDTFLRKFNSDNKFLIHMADDWVIYWEGKSAREAQCTDCYIKRAKRDGTKANTIVKDTGTINIAGMTVYQNYLFYNDTAIDDGTLYRVGLDGKGKIKITDKYTNGIPVYGSPQVTSSLVHRMLLGAAVNSEPVFIRNNKIYYQRYMEIYQVDINGKNNKKVLGSKVGNVGGVDGDWIYTDTWWKNSLGGYGGGGPIYKVSTTNQKPVQLTNGSTWISFVEGGWIYMFDESYSFIRLKNDGSKREVIVSVNPGEDMALTELYNDWIIYTFYDVDGQKAEYRIRKDGTGKTLIRTYDGSEWGY